MEQFVFCVQKQKKSDRGFTLVETLVAITILLVVIVGPLTIAQSGIQNAVLAKQQTTAVLLAQEAVEYLMLLRDNNALSVYDEYIQDIQSGGNGAHGGNTMQWYDDIPANSDCKSASGCDVEVGDAPNSNNFHSCQTSADCLLEFNTSANDYPYYGYGSGNNNWVASPFKRVIKLGAESNGGIPVTVTVSWDGPGALTNRSVIIQTWIYDQYQRYQ